MRSKLSPLLYPLAALLTFAVGLTACYLYGRARVVPDDGSLTSLIRRAKHRGDSFVKMTPVTACYGYVFTGTDDPLREALAHYTVILAEPLEAKTYVSEHGLYTWERFRVIETLSARPRGDCGGCLRAGEPPGDMRPLKDDEIFVSQAGGMTVIDGIQVIDEGYTSYLPPRKYLLFITDMMGCGHRGMVAMGPGGVFTVEDDGLIEPIAIDWGPLRKYIARHCCNSLSQLRAKIQQM